jgi:hypothetical protein
MDSKDTNADMKYDGGKLKAAIPFQDFPDSLQELVAVCTMGANKYARHSWQQVDNKEERYKDAFARHFFASFREDLDPESGYDHLAHVAWNALALLQMKLEQN